MSAERSSGWWETIKIVIEALIIAMVVRVFFYQPFNIPSGSMKDTLLIGDYLFVSKLSYGYSKYSFTSSFDLFNGRIFSAEPKRGDVIVFKLPRDNSTDYIKRLIGLPGDEIRVSHGVLFINGQEVPRVPDGEYVSREDGRAKRYKEGAKLVRQAIKAEPDNIDTWRLACRLTAADPDGGAVKALRMLDEVVKKFDDRTILRLDRADMYMMLNDEEMIQHVVSVSEGRAMTSSANGLGPSPLLAPPPLEGSAACARTSSMNAASSMTRSPLPLARSFSPAAIAAALPLPRRSPMTR